MLFFFRRSSELPAPGSFIGRSMLIFGIISILFGIAIVIDPALLADLIAIFFIVMGFSLIMTWSKLRN